MVRFLFASTITLFGALTTSAVQVVRDYTVDGRSVRLAPDEQVVDLAKIYPDGIGLGKPGERWATVEAVLKVPTAGWWRFYCQNDWFGELSVNDVLVSTKGGPCDEWRPVFAEFREGENRVRCRTRAGLGGWSCGFAQDDVLNPHAPVLRADFRKSVCPLRPALHSSGFGPTICSQTAQDLADVKSMGFKFARTHDWALINPNQRVCDYFHVFPLMHLDAKDPKNYWFGPTDYLLKRTREEAGLEIFYRLGTSIEHSGHKIHFNALIPSDFDKMAEIFAGTIRHYNRGWANGYEWGIKYWEIWNEPEGIQNMWSPAEGTEGLDADEIAQKRAVCRQQFVRFFVTVLKRLKSEFGDTVKVGGPALCNYNVVWMEEILKACREAGVAPDFVSWHGYTNNPRKFCEEAERGRALLDKYGFTSCEQIVNEWHYFGENYSWVDMQRCSDPQVKARIWEGPDSHNGIRSACFTLATLANMQRSKLDQAYFYGCSHRGAWGFKDDLQKKYRVFYALQLFGEIVRNYTTMCESVSEGTVTAFAVKTEKGKKGLLLVDYGGMERTIILPVSGVAPQAKVTARLLDDKHDLSETAVEFSEGVLTVTKPDFHSAAFFVEFAE